jgi:hypothetical protein
MPHSFLAEWEFRRYETKGAQVPDAVLVVNVHGHERRLAVEVDCGTENASVLAEKLLGYQAVLTAGRLTGVVMFLPGQRRIKATVVACFKLGVLGDGQCWMADVDTLWEMDASTNSFLNLQSLTVGEPAMDSLDTLLSSPFALSCRGERTSVLSAAPTGVSSAVGGPIYVES